MSTESGNVLALTLRVFCKTITIREKIMKEFDVIGLKLQFSDAIENYAEQYRLYLEIADKIIEQFEEIYNNYGSADTMINKVIEDCGTLLRYQSDIYIKSVVDSGCYDINVEIFLENYLLKIRPYFYVHETYEVIFDQYNEIGKNKQEIEAYRELRKQSRGKFVGGGFGISGAVKGAVGAGALNMVTGLGHSAVNVVGNIGTGIAASRQKRKLYENDKTKNALCVSLRRDMFNIFLANLLMLEERFGMVFDGGTTEDRKKSAAIIENIWKQELSDEEEIRIIENLFQLDPYNADLYEYILCVFGDKDSQLEEVASFFGVDIDALKYDVLEELINELPKESYEDYKNLLCKMDECIKENGIRKDIYEELYGEIKSKFYELKKIESSFEGIEYESPEVAQIAKNEKEKLDEIYHKIDFKTEKGLELGKKQLEKYTTQAYSKDTYIEDVIQKLNTVIEKREVDELKLLFREVESLSKEELIKIKEELKKKKLKVVPIKPYLTEINDLIDNYEINQRTIDNVVYDTKEIADIVRTEKVKCQEIIDIINSDDKNSILYAMDSLKALKLQYVNKQPYIDKINEMYIEHTQERIMISIDVMLKQKKFKQAMEMVNTADLSNENKNRIVLVMSELTKEYYSEEIKIGKNYNPKKNSFFELLLGAAVIVFIGYVLSGWFPIAFKISIALAVLGIIGNYLPNDEEKKKKEAYELIQELIKYGYIVD